MAITNQDRVGKAMDLLRAGLAPVVEREVQAAVKAGNVRMDAIRRLADDPMLGQKPIAQREAAGILRPTWETWNDVFGRTLGHAERSLVQELRDGHKASRISDEGVAHLAGQLGAEVRVTLEAEATPPGGSSDQIVRTVAEN